eukprot:TRINITY_DN22095_c0_g1_i1.p1 TRINITY_DN22095_c0_g1~~TRINITY_DN22095_c0_g1_i1.p1  ORF type:complete len:860 (+),score=239.54 TRINITY_DN22095_c0_g1_i1:74-2581(+)
MVAVAPASAVAASSKKGTSGGVRGKAKTGPPRTDLLPDDSSDQEGGSSTGVRLRVRVTREASEKWGVKWHKNIFKMSNRLIVDEVAEKSVLGAWNARHPEQFQVGYGDRLLRINGVSLSDLPSALLSERMKTELQKETMRALFWRPGSLTAEEVAFASQTLEEYEAKNERSNSEDKGGDEDASDADTAEAAKSGVQTAQSTPKPEAAVDPSHVEQLPGAAKEDAASAEKEEEEEVPSAATKAAVEALSQHCGGCSLVRTASENLLLGVADSAAGLKPAELRSRGIGHILRLGFANAGNAAAASATAAELPSTDAQLSCPPSAGGGAVASSLRSAAASLADVLKAASEAAAAASSTQSAAAASNPAVASASSTSAAEVNDTAPGASSEEEGGSSDGVRLRIRVSRNKGEKWGVKWHEKVFKQTNRLMVEDVTEGSVLGRWNERQPENRRVDYGDRLIRINGVGLGDLPPAQLSAKMRAELQRDSMRALFWRPRRPDDDEAAAGDQAKATSPLLASAPTPSAPSSAAGSAVLVCASAAAGGVEAAAAVAVTHLLQARGAAADGSLALADAVTASLGDELASALAWQQLAEACKVDGWLQALQRLASGTEGDAEKTGNEATYLWTKKGITVLQGYPTSVSKALGYPRDDDVVTGRQLKLAAEKGLTATKLLTDGLMIKASLPVEEPQADSGAGEDAKQDTSSQAAKKTPEWVYSCRKCNSGLFTDVHVLPHNTDGNKMSGRNWHATYAAAGAGPPEDACTSVYVEPMKWMGELVDQTGRLVCGNPRCKQKLGGYSWHGMPCSCGHWQSPAFQIQKARLDCMPIQRKTRGAAPEAVFKG